MIRNVILDWSGTVADDLAPVHAATNLIFRHYGKPELVIEEFRKHFVLPFDSFYASLLPGVPLAELDEVFHEHFATKQEEVHLLPHALAFLQFCHATQRRLFLLSTIKRMHFDRQASRLQVAHFFEKLYLEVMDKREQIKTIIEENGLTASETIFVGDMAHDIETARHGGVTGIATLTGFDSLEKLSAANPDVIVRNLGELQKLMDDAEADQIHIDELELHAHVGVPEAERANPQRLLASITLVPLRDFRNLHDDLDRTVDYAAVCEEVKNFVRDRSDKLIETLADQIALHLLEVFAIARVRIELRKFILPETRYVSVKVMRNRNK